MVTPFAGVWIEIVKCTMRIMLLVSLPSRECGLKFINFTTKDMKAKSLPSRECGLKYLCTSYLILIINRHSLRGSVD